MSLCNLQHSVVSITDLFCAAVLLSLAPGATKSASWRRSGSHNASGSKLSSSDLSVLRIDDLRDLVKKTGAELPREPTKDGVISALISKGVSLNDLTRGKFVRLLFLFGMTLCVLTALFSFAGDYTEHLAACCSVLVLAVNRPRCSTT